MKVAQIERSIVTSGQFEQTTSVIAQTASMFTLLSDKLYRNKPRAVIREICCNAADAHVESGNTDPFLVCLPNSLMPYFKVKDTGLGLSHEDVMHLYQNYGVSTRDGTNTVTGGFGLGSKSPYAYVETFGVVSYFQGEKRTYVCFRNEAGIPSTTLTATEETDEPNGLEVSFRVEEQDFYTFYDEAVHVLQAFKTLPTIEGTTLDFPEEEILAEGEGWEVLRGKPNKWNKHRETLSSRVRMGNVDYVIPQGSLDKLSHENATMWRELGIVIHVPVGVLSPTPSREDLEISGNLVGVVESALTEIRTVLLETFEQKIEVCKSMWDARLVLAEFKDSPEWKLVSPGKGGMARLKWRGQQIQKGIRAPALVRITEYSKSSRYDHNLGASAATVKKEDINVFVPKADDVIVVNNLKGNDFKLKNYVRHEIPGKTGRLLLITTRTLRELKQFQKVIGKGQLGLAAGLDLSEATKQMLKDRREERRGLSQVKDLSGVTRSPTSRRKRGTVQGFDLIGGHGTHENSWEAIEGGVEYQGTQGVYVLLNRWGALPNNAPGEETLRVEQLTEVVECLNKYSWREFELVGIKQAHAEKVRNEPGWIPLNALVLEVYKLLTNSSEYHARTVRDQSSFEWSQYGAVPHPFWDKVEHYDKGDTINGLVRLAQTGKLATTSKFTKLLKGMELYAQCDQLETDMGTLETMLRYIDHHRRSQKAHFSGKSSEEGDLYWKLSGIWDKYPLLTEIKYHRMPEDKLIDYINLVDSQEN